jgi:corticosteroid 11-beta-dehydrogenase isozyme 1
MLGNIYLFIVSISIVTFIHVFVCPLDLYLLDPSNKIAGRNVIVTGASQGIGKYLALEYARLGAKSIVIASRSRERLENLQSEIQSTYANVAVFVCPVDLSTEESSVSLVNFSMEKMGSIDFLVLNHITSARYGLWLEDSAGTFKPKNYLKEIYEVNTFSYIWTVSAAMKFLVSSGGEIVVVSSLAGHVGVPHTALYASSKHALHGFFNALRSEMRIMGINNVGVTLCAIGATDTEGAQDAKARLTKVAWDSPVDAAFAIVKGSVARKEEIFHPHHKIYPGVFIHSLFPELFSFLLRLTM